MQYSVNGHHVQYIHKSFATASLTKVVSSLGILTICVDIVFAALGPNGNVTTSNVS